MKTKVLVALLFICSITWSQVTVKSFQTMDGGNWRCDTSTSSTTWKACYLPSMGRDFGYQVVPTTFSSGVIRVAFTYADTAAIANNRAKGFSIPYFAGDPYFTFEQVKFGRDTCWVKADSGTIYYQIKF